MTMKMLYLAAAGVRQKPFQIIVQLRRHLCHRDSARLGFPAEKTSSRPILYLCIAHAGSWCVRLVHTSCPAWSSASLISDHVRGEKSPALSNTHSSHRQQEVLLGLLRLSCLQRAQRGYMCLWQAVLPASCQLRPLLFTAPTELDH